MQNDGIFTLTIPSVSSSSSSSSSSLVVAVCPPRYQVPTSTTTSTATTTSDDNDNHSTTTTSRLWDAVHHVSYVGADLLLTHEYPQGMEHVLPPALLAANHHPNVSFDIAQVALHTKARYHVVPSTLVVDPSHVTQNHGTTTTTTTRPIFGQSHPFGHLQATTSTTTSCRHFGRLVTIPPVQAPPPPSSSSSTKKTHAKTFKYLHALGIVPLMECQTSDLVPPKNLQPCPFTDLSYPTDEKPTTNGTTSTSTKTKKTSTSTLGMSHAMARRILAQERRSGSGAPSRWTSTTTQKRHRLQDEQDWKEQQVMSQNESLRSLFVHGLHKDVSHQLQTAERGDAMLMHALRQLGHVPTRIRRPTTASTAFLFVDFATHQAAKDCWEQTQGLLMVNGVDLQIKWAKQPTNPHDTHTTGHQHNKRPRRDEGPSHHHHHHHLTEEQAKESSSVYYKVVLETNQKILNQSVVSQMTLALQGWMQHVLEDALNDANSKPGDRITAETEPALQVQVRCHWKEETNTNDNDNDDDDTDKPSSKQQGPTNNNKNNNNHNKTSVYGFLDFASHAAASMALASLTESVEGGRVVVGDNDRTTKTTEKHDSNKNTKEDKDDKDVSNKDTATTSTTKSSSRPTVLQQTGIFLHWTIKPSRHERRQEEMIYGNSNNNGFTFRRQHFPPDARHDCWFCLASESCETHLLVGVYDHWYMAMPKGPCHPSHVLLIPVVHTSKGALLSEPDALDELERLKEGLRQHALSQDCQLFVFERAIATRGGYHTHLQCIPVPMDKCGMKLQATLLAQAKHAGMTTMREMASDLAVSAVLRDEESKTDGYFYAEVPFGTNKASYKRFLYQHSSSSSSSSSQPPLQLGREVIASVMENAKLAHWKACVVDTDTETQLARTLRDSLTKYMP